MTTARIVARIGADPLLDDHSALLAERDLSILGDKEVLSIAVGHIQNYAGCAHETAVKVAMSLPMETQRREKYLRKFLSAEEAERCLSALAYIRQVATTEQYNLLLAEVLTIVAN